MQMNSKDLTLRVPRGALLAAAAVLLVAAALFARGITTGSAAEPTKEITVYSVAQKEVYINNSDDRERGVGKNPFSEDSNVPSPKSNKLPAAGDNILAVNGLFSDPGAKKKIGEATASCGFNFASNASCDLTIRLSGGNLLASGAVHFKSKHLILAIIGGTGAYKGAGGEMHIDPGGPHSQKWTISLL
jgi:hypothetical protein